MECSHADFVRAVDDVDDSLRVLVVLLPQISIPPSARHVEDSEVDATAGKAKRGVGARIRV
jgi:hypothetical protein